MRYSGSLLCQSQCAKRDGSSSQLGMSLSILSLSSCRVSVSAAAFLRYLGSWSARADRRPPPLPRNSVSERLACSTGWQRRGAAACSSQLRVATRGQRWSAHSLAYIYTRRGDIHIPILGVQYSRPNVLASRVFRYRFKEGIPVRHARSLRSTMPACHSPISCKAYGR